MLEFLLSLKVMKMTRVSLATLGYGMSGSPVAMLIRGASVANWSCRDIQAQPLPRAMSSSMALWQPRSRVEFMATVAT